MARIPRLTGRRAQVQGLPNVRSDAGATEANFGVDVSGVAGVATDVISRARERANTAAVMEADSSLTEFENQALFDPEQGALNQRGRNAFDAPERVMDSFDQRVSEIRQNLRGEQVQAFDRMVNQRRAQINKTLQRHVSSEIQTYEQQQADALIQNSQIAAANHYNDPERIGMELRRQRGAVLARSRDMGWSPEKTQAALQQAETRTHGAVIDRMAANDPKAATKYYLQHAPSMSPEVRNQFDSIIRDRRNLAEADAIVSSLTGTGTVGVDGVWQRMIQRESGGQQFNAQGEMLTSSAGAGGIAQVMPGTAPEAARMAGLEWDEERYRNDPEYNLALGRAYFDHQVEKYDGNPVLASAAYNAGPGIVDDWINGTNRTGDNPSKTRLGRPGEDLTLEEWTSRIPYKETREYVRAVTQGMDQPEPTRSQQLAALTGLPDDVREPAKDRLEAQWAIEDRRKEEIYTAAQERIEGGDSFDSLPTQLKGLLSNEQKNALRSRQQELAGVEIQTNWQKWTELSMMSPEELAQIDDPYTELRPHLDDTRYRKAVEMISEAKGIGGDVETSSTMTFNQRIKNTARQAGIVPADRTPARYSEDQALNFGRFQSEAAARIEEAERQRGSKLTGNEQQEIIDELVTERVMIDQTFGDEETFLWAIDEDETGNAYIPIEDIPEGDNQEIRNLMISNGVVPTNESVQRAFAQYRLNDLQAFQDIIRGE